jgi:hypothetical protein
MMLDAGFDPRVGDDEALVQACAAGHLAVVKILLERSSSTDPSGTKTYPAATARNNSPLFAAASQGRTEVVRLLLDSGADPAANHLKHMEDEEETFLVTPAMAAASGGWPETVRALAERNDILRYDQGEKIVKYVVFNLYWVYSKEHAYHWLDIMTTYHNTDNMTERLADVFELLFELGCRVPEHTNLLLPAVNSPPSKFSDEAYSALVAKYKITQAGRDAIRKALEEIRDGRDQGQKKHILQAALQEAAI